MTGLHNTDLTTSQANQGTFGLEYEISRPTIYRTQETANEVLSQHFSQTQEQLKAQKILDDQAQLDRTIIDLHINSPNSIRAIEDLIPIIYPGLTRSFGSIRSLLIEAQEKA